MNQHFALTLSVEQSPTRVFDTINDVRGWWSGQIDGETSTLGAEFTYRYKDMHVSTQRVTELVPGRRIVWSVVDSRLSFLKNDAEWTGTKIIFDLSPKGAGTEIRFSHEGLTEESECYGACSNGWGKLVNDNLRSRIVTGANQPDVFA